MISDALRTDIEKWVAQRDQNPLLRMAQQGTLTAAMIMRYIANATHMVRLTPGHILTARDGARAAGDEALASHYQHKFDEEVGHARWGERDLESLKRLASAPADPSVTVATQELAKYLADSIALDPATYLAYLAFSEHITVALGPELLTLVEERCGIPRSSLSLIENHVELDIEHVEEGWAVIDDLVGDPRKIGLMRKALEGMISRFDACIVEITSSEAPRESVALPLAAESGVHLVDGGAPATAEVSNGHISAA